MQLTGARLAFAFAFAFAGPTLLAACEHSTYEGGGRRTDIGDAALGTTVGIPDAGGAASEAGSGGSNGELVDCSAGAGGELFLQTCP